jgi:hypothetical protein
VTTKLSRDDLYSLEKYAEVRKDFRSKVLEHKKNRQVHLGAHATLYFEDRLTMQYQIQEMLRIEKVFEAAGIQEELDAYNPLIPDGCNWKATFMMEYPDVEQRKVELAKLGGIEDKVWVQVVDFDRVYGIANEDLDRTDEATGKTSAVHFMRFELTPEMATAIKGGAAVSMGVEHPNYTQAMEPIPAAVRDSLAADLA